MQQDILRLIENKYPKMSKGQKRIADFILAHYNRAVQMTAARLARQIDISESTVVRFATSLGYEGYPEMQRALAEALRTRLTTVQRIEMSSAISLDDVLPTVLKRDVQNIRGTLNEIDPAVFHDAVETIISARRLYVLGLRSAAPLAQFLGYYLGFIFQDVHIVTGSVGYVYEELLRIGKDDCLISMSFPRYSSRTVDGTQFAKARGASVVALTDSPRSPIARVADYTLTARSDMAFFADSLVAPMSIINALIVAIGLSKKDDVMDYLHSLEGIWEQGQVYTGKERGEEE
jgi:DNA-binding MurR/RpiR family transcriptional regulator